MRCLTCHRDWPEEYRWCPQCLEGLLRDGDPDVRRPRLVRDAGSPPFSTGTHFIVHQLSPGGSIVYTGPDGMLEANVVLMRRGDGHERLTCVSQSGDTVFYMAVYEARAGALSCMAADDLPLASYVLQDGDIDVRDGTGAPVATLYRVNHRLVETGGQAVALCTREDV